VASERQIAANRRNAQKSTGPRSRVGKKRASGNAFRHGLAVSLSSTAFAKQAEELARQIAHRTADAIALEHARTAAEAELELRRVRCVKVALIERVYAFGSLETPTRFRSINEELRWLKGLGPPIPKLQDPAATMPQQEPYRSSEAIRRLLPELIKLDRYERRAVSRRDRAIRALAQRTRQLITQSSVADDLSLQNEANTPK
jgi:hypothetical protein